MKNKHSQTKKNNMNYLLLSELYGEKSIAVIEYTPNKELLKQRVQKAISEYTCDEVDIIDIILPKNGNDGTVIYEDSFEVGDIEVRIEQIEIN